ncbi:MAG: ABC transporter substrate-binding protein [Chitinophagales bacterium]|nr:hypothetical protein [Bacteroidota bacterium]
MNYSLKAFTISFLAFLALGITSCGGSGDSGSRKKTYQDQLVIHNLSDPEGLHPTNVSDANATEIKRYMFQKLLTINFVTLELEPWLAKKMPTMEVTGNNEGMLIHYELKDGLTWDDGKPITPRDVEFSLMALKDPKVDDAHLRPYFDFISDFKYDPENPNAFTLVCNKTYMLWDHVTGNDFWIIPEHLYDPNGYLKNMKLADFADEKKAGKNDNAIKFADDYNNVKYSREKDFVNGSGPYKLADWQTDQRIILERKDNWSGDKYNGTSMMFDKGPKRIVWETVNDFSTAITALKAEKLDVITSVPPADWVKLPESDKFKENYRESTPPFTTYSYIGLHKRNPILADKRTRQALAHLIDADNINKNLLYGLQTRIIGPIHPSDKMNYNTNIKPYDYNPEKAKQLLAEVGWKDTDGDGILDKVINGKKTPFKLAFKYNQGNDIRKNVGLAFKESARQAGIELEVSPEEWSVYLEKLKKHEIDMFYGAWVMDPRPDDPIQLFSTAAYNGGSNYVGFGDAETDKLIDQIRTELDPEKRKALYYRYQEIMHDEVPYIFLFTSNRRNAIHKRFTNLHEGARDPGYWGGGFQIDKGFASGGA